MHDKSQKYLELESLRGLAALLVVFYHLPKWNPVLDLGLINNGYLMVELFFVISGFVIFNAYAERINSWRDLIKFQFLRFGRIYPVHLLFLLLFLSIEILKYISLNLGKAQQLKVEPFSDNSFQALIEQIFLLQSVLPNRHDTTYNPLAWSISVEYYTYLIFALATLFFKKHKNKVFFVLASISMILLILDLTFGLQNLLRCLAGFFIGCLANYLVNKKPIKPAKYVSLLIGILFLAFLQIKDPYDMDIIVYIIAGMLIVSLVMVSDGILNVILDNRFFRWLGEISYSVYMSHVFIIWVISQIFIRVLKRPETTAFGVVDLSVGECILAIFLVTVSVLTASQLVYTFIEKPFRERSRRYVLTTRTKTNNAWADPQPN